MYQIIPKNDITIIKVRIMLLNQLEIIFYYNFNEYYYLDILILREYLQLPL